MATIASRDPIAPRHPLPAALEEALAALDTVRERTLALVAHLSDEQLTRVLSPIMSPLVWDLAHIAAYEDLWLAHRHGGLDLLRGELAELYDAFETPRSIRGEVELLQPEQARSYLREVRDARRRGSRPRGRGRRDDLRAGAAPRAAAHRDDAPDDGARGAAAGRRATPGAARGRRRSGSTCRPGRSRWGRGRRVRLRQRAPPPHRRAARLPDRAPPRDQRELDELQRGGRV